MKDYTMVQDIFGATSGVPISVPIPRFADLMLSTFPRHMARCKDWDDCQLSSLFKTSSTFEKTNLVALTGCSS